jgi:hypothetical protein
MKLGPGTRLSSAVCETEVIVVRPPADDVDLRCGGAPMVPLGEGAPGGAELDAAFAEGTALGKRYTDAEGSLELLATKAGAGSLSIGSEALVLKEAKPLPSSD